MVILGKIFLNNGWDEKTRWEWYDQTDDTSKVEWVRRGDADGKWPEGDFLSRIFQVDGRKTVKIMEV
jgi:hypothetical protein